MTTGTAPLSADELAGVASILQREGVELDGPLESSVIAGGRSNVTLRVTDGHSCWVLRMPPRHGRTPSAHDVGREHRVTRGLGRVGFPVPKAIALCEDESVVGGPFAVSEFVDGTVIQSREDIDELDDETLDGAITSLVAQLAALHAVDVERAGLSRLGRPDNYASRQARRWTQQWAIVGDPSLDRLAMEVSAKLSENVPAQHVTSIVHGDYRIDNTLMVLDPVPRVAAVVDWEMSTLGDPVADVAMMCAYRDDAFDQVIGTATAWTSPRLPGRSELAEAYVHAGGVPLRDWHLHLGLAQFKIAVISAGIDHRSRANADGGRDHTTAGAAVEPFLEQALISLQEVS